VSDNLKQHWSYIAMLIANGATPDKRDIAGALRDATPEIDDITRLMHTPEVAAFLQVRQEGFDPAVEQFIGALSVLLFKSLPIIPAEVQHYIADLIDPPKRPAHRPKQKLTDMARMQRELQKLDKARQDVDQMRALQARHGTEAAALAEFARARGITVPRAKRRYRQATEKVKVDRAQMASVIEQYNRGQRALCAAASEIAAALIEMEDLDFNEKLKRIADRFPDATEMEIDLAFGLAAGKRRDNLPGRNDPDSDEITPPSAK
jgi:hypothetical protein